MSLLIYSYFLKYKTTVEEIVSVISSDLSFKEKRPRFRKIFTPMEGHLKLRFMEENG